MITEINRNIEYINRVLFNCERFIDDTILEYMSAQEKIMSIYNRFENAEILKGEKNITSLIQTGMLIGLKGRYKKRSCPV